MDRVLVLHMSSDIAFYVSLLMIQVNDHIDIDSQKKYDAQKQDQYQIAEEVQEDASAPPQHSQSTPQIRKWRI